MKTVVGIADMKVSNNVAETLTTYALGSCLGITVYDPNTQVGGLLHVMLPLSTIDQRKAAQNPYMFVDTGLPLLFLECYKLGGVKEHLIVKVAGGATTHGKEEDDLFQIGKRNFVVLRKLLWRNGVLLHSYDVGGTQSRTMSLDINSGTVTLRINNTTKPL